MFRVENQIVPALRVNNRSVNQTFLEENLGMKTWLEEGPFVELGALTSPTVQLVLVESPSMRTRAVQGPKKLAKIVIKVAQAQEIEALLARGASFTNLYKGKKGYAFEATSPEGDCFLLHAEENRADLVAILPPAVFTASEDFDKLTEFEVEAIYIRSPQPAVSQAFYQKLLPNQQVLFFQEGQGPDLLTAAEEVWDLDSLRLKVAKDANWSDLEEQLEVPYFKDRKGRFLQTLDPSKIELWFEK